MTGASDSVEVHSGLTVRGAARTVPCQKGVFTANFSNKPRESEAHYNVLTLKYDLRALWHMFNNICFNPSSFCSQIFMDTLKRRRKEITSSGCRVTIIHVFDDGWRKPRGGEAALYEHLNMHETF